MAKQEAIITVNKAEKEDVAFVPNKAISDIVLVPLPEEEDQYKEWENQVDEGSIIYTPPNATGNQSVEIKPGYWDDYPADLQKLLPNIRMPTPKKSVLPDSKALVFDLETTGTEPWKSRLLLGSFLGVGEEKRNMVSFVGNNEYEVMVQITEYLNSVNPTLLIGANPVFDTRWLAVQCMAWSLPCPPVFEAEVYGILDVLKNGREEYLYSTQKSGSLEDWAMYFWNDKKPYTIEECLTAYDKGDLAPYLIRNRWDVAATFDIYNVIKAHVEGKVTKKAVRGTTLTETQGAGANGIYKAQCPVCLAAIETQFTNNEARCPICNSSVPASSITE